MTRTTSTVIAIAIWGAGLVPAAVIMQWLGMVGWTWGGFFSAYLLLAAISFSYEYFLRWMERRLVAPTVKTGAPSDH